jgi:DNA sulfur modification protein DndD
MTATLRILGWEATGLRCPDHKISCSREDDTPYAVSLIQMPNGTGKTTTLTLLRSALSGRLPDEESSPESVRAFRKRGSDSDNGAFVAHLLLNGRRVTIQMTFDFQDGRVSFKTTHGSGQENRFNPPPEFRRFLNPEFVKFLIFDGELARDLTDKTQIQAEKVVNALFQINALRSLQSAVHDYWAEQTERSDATDQKALTRRRNRFNELEGRLKILKKQRANALQVRAKITEDLTKKRSEYQSELGREETRAAEMDEAEGRFKEAADRVERASLDILDRMRDPHAMSPLFAIRLQELKAGLDRVKLPEGAAREFFEELSNEEFCICGRPIDEHISGVIRQRAQQYLGNDDVALLNSLKTAIHDVASETLSGPSQILSAEVARLHELVRERQAANTLLSELRNQASETDPRIKDVSDAIKDLEERLRNNASLLKAYDDTDESKRIADTTGITVIDNWLKRAEQQVAEITGTLLLKDQRDILTEILSGAFNRARTLVVQEIVHETNQRIRTIIPSNNVSVDRIDQCLILKGQEGASMGETLSVAYAFLSTLFSRSDHELPFVVDSPAGSIDNSVRPQIGRLVPRLTSQFIAFTISSERQAFVPHLKVAANDDALFLTIFRKGSAADTTTSATVDRVETSDGVMISGEGFFNQFQYEGEA